MKCKYFVLKVQKISTMHKDIHLKRIYIKSLQLMNFGTIATVKSEIMYKAQYFTCD